MTCDKINHVLHSRIDLISLHFCWRSGETPTAINVSFTDGLFAVRLYQTTR